ncbi:hypothetical protein GHT06_011596 [Daphnia sinensis]|uniref:Uncharacterized protein n=1 Tax=Daphnia sinensis TaxID=1820382 RepID=A0AAD5KU57_9CRUS|nr:hypothetical protein GHT06_011596 [Daphnia sinensis]
MSQISFHIKRESEDDDAVKIVELPIPVAISDDIPCEPLEVLSSRAGSLLEGSIVMYIVQSVCNQYGDEISSALPNSSLPLDDVKLKLGCRVVFEGLPKCFTVSEGEEIPENPAENSNHHSKNPSVKAELKGKELKGVVNLEKPTSSLDDYSDEDEVLPSKPRIEVSNVPISSTPSLVKAKVTKISRGDMFLKDLVGEEQMSKEGVKKGPTSALSGFCIPKISKSAVEPSSDGQEASTSTGVPAQKRKHPDHDEDRLNQAQKKKKKVSFVEANNKIYKIEARPPTPTLPFRTPVRPIDQTALTGGKKIRIHAYLNYANGRMTLT